MAFRAFFALPADKFTTSGGQHTNAVHGFVSMLANLIKNEQPTHVAVAFDAGSTTFRTERFPQYKGGRAATPEPFKGQVPLIREVLDALRITHYEREMIEADDILATWSYEASSRGWDVLVCSGDRDSLQFVTDTVTVRPLAVDHDEELAQAQRVMRDSALLGRPWGKVPSLREFTIDMRKPSSSERLEPYVAVLEGQVAGLLLMWFPLHDNTKFMWFDLHVDPQLRRRGVGSALADQDRRAAVLVICRHGEPVGSFGAQAHTVPGKAVPLDPAVADLLEQQTEGG